MMNAEKINMDYEGVEVPDYYGDDGLLHCGVCHEAKEAYLPEGKEWLGRKTHPRMCLCDRTEYERQEKREKQLEHEQEVSRLRAKCFTDKYMNNWTFENDNGLNPKMKEARDYVVNWEEKEKENNGLLLWGGVGTGKSYMVGCIANALLEQEVTVLMTNFATILNDLNSHYADRNEYIQSLCRNRLLIIDDLGMERGTDYGISVTPEQQEHFLEFIRTDKHYNKYYDAVYILFHTGLRISEFCGLTLADIDMKERIIHVNHQLQRLSDMQYVITQTKTDCGVRDLPMTQGVYECFQRILKARRRPKVEPMIDNKIGFLFLDKNGMPKVAGHWQKYFNHMVGKYNRTHTVQMSGITPHVCRHTYCTNMTRAGMNPKSLQYLMGHSEVATTMDVYTHFGYEEAKVEVGKVSGR